MGQSRGAIEGQEYDRCAEGIGPFTSCVTVEGMFGGSCTNCHFGSRGKKCSFRYEETEKRPKRSTKRAGIECKDEGSIASSERARKRKQVNMYNRFRKIGTFLAYLAEEFNHIADELEE